MKTVINILGTGRSGSTMLDLMLGSSPSAFSCGEVGSWFHPWAKQHFAIKCTCGNEPCPVWDVLKRVPRQDFHEAVFQKLNVDFVVDSSAKNLYWLIDTYNAVSPEVRIVNLLIWKDPIDLAYSYWKRSGDLLKWRCMYIQYHKRIFGLGIPFMSVHYRALVEDPASKLRQVCERIDMPYCLGMEKFWLNEHHFLFGSYGVQQQVRMRKSFIYQKEPFPDSFMEHYSQLQRTIDGDKELAYVLGMLRNSEAGNIAKMEFVRPEYVRRPVRYYLHALKRVFRRYCPEDYKPKDVNPVYGAGALTKVHDASGRCGNEGKDE